LINQITFYFISYYLLYFTQVISPSPDAEISDTDMEDGEDLQHKGTIDEIGGTRIYQACPIPPCMRKKLIDGRCPRCEQDFDDERSLPTTMTKLTMKYTEDQHTQTLTVFNATIELIFAHLKQPIPNSTDTIEDTILDVLPLECTFSTGQGTSVNILTKIGF